MTKKWTIVDSSYPLQDRWLTVRADSCRTAEGHAVAPYYVLEYTDWANVVALTDDEDVVLVRQYRHALGTAVLELPGGCVDEGETPAEAVRRELLEETGFAVDELVETGRVSPNPATHTNMTHCFLARGAHRYAEPKPEADENLEVLCLGLSEVVDRAATGSLSQALHMASLLFALRALGRL